MNNHLFRKLFVSHRFFTIALKRKGELDFVDTGTFEPEFVFPATWEAWQADPMIIENGDHTFLFYEKVYRDHGHIEVVEVFDDCTISKPVTILKSDNHYSYPFVFSYDDIWYMIPESSQNMEAALYKAIDFPYHWKKEAVLLKDKVVDTTVFKYRDKMILLTFRLMDDSESVEPHAFEFVFNNNEYHLLEIPWKDFDSLKVRGAGGIMTKDQRYMRPAQISLEQSYGEGLTFYEIDVNDVYREIKYKDIMSDGIVYKNKGLYVDGLHTYSSTSKFEVIDIRVGNIDHFKPIRKLQSVLFK